MFYSYANVNFHIHEFSGEHSAQRLLQVSDTSLNVPDTSLPHFLFFAKYMRFAENQQIVVLVKTASMELICNLNLKVDCAPYCGFPQWSYTNNTLLKDTGNVISVEKKSRLNMILTFWGSNKI